MTHSREVANILPSRSDAEEIYGRLVEKPFHMGNEVPKFITFQPNIYGKVLNLIPTSRQARILDVGAGEGYLSRKLKDMGYTVEACDFLENNFKCPDVPFHKADLSKSIPLADGLFDCVVSVEVIEHVENHFQFVRELVRMAKPGGTIIITTPNILSFSSRAHFFLYGYTDCAPLPLDPDREDYFMQHINPISLPELIFCLERAGADIETLTTNRYRRGNRIYMAFWYPLMAVAIRLKFLRKKYAATRELHKRHIRWVLHPANLLGRITIAVARKRDPK